jgi:hypothetical protein
MTATKTVESASFAGAFDVEHEEVTQVQTRKSPVTQARSFVSWDQPWNNFGSFGGPSRIHVARFGRKGPWGLQ